MPLLFLLTYVFITYFIYKKNKDNIENIPLIIKLNGIIAFGLLFVFIVYYSGGNNLSVDNNIYAISFYFLLLSYIVIFSYHLLNYRIEILKNKKKITSKGSSKGVIENNIDTFYFILVVIFALIYFLYSSPIKFYGNNQIDLFIYIVLGLSSIYILFEKKILS